MRFFSVLLRDNLSKGSSYNTEHYILSSHYSGRNRVTMSDNGLRFNSCRCCFFFFVCLFVCLFVCSPRGGNKRKDSIVL